jgi:transposase
MVSEEGTVARRRMRTISEKRRIVEETLVRGASAPVIALPAGVKVWLAAGATAMRNGFDGLAGLVQTQLTEDPFSGQLFVFRGRRGDRI